MQVVFLFVAGRCVCGLVLKIHRAVGLANVAKGETHWPPSELDIHPLDLTPDLVVTFFVGALS